MDNKTQNRRIYAIGDIHGQLHKLEQVQRNIRDDLSKRPHDDVSVVYLGDFCDRGPKTKGVIENLINEKDAHYETYFMRGNHDVMFTLFLDNPKAFAIRDLHWFNPVLGGVSTLESYGVDGASEENATHVRSAFADAVPKSHLDFMSTLTPYVQIGSYVFVHAGIRHGIALDKQEPEDLIWIREPFLSCKEDYGFTVVHGHSPVKKVENHGNRIAVDTGAAFGRELSCVVLENDEQYVLEDDTLKPLLPI